MGDRDASEQVIAMPGTGDRDESDSVRNLQFISCALRARREALT